MTPHESERLGARYEPHFHLMHVSPIVLGLTSALLIISRDLAAQDDTVELQQPKSALSEVAASPSESADETANLESAESDRSTDEEASMAPALSLEAEDVDVLNDEEGEPDDDDDDDKGKELSAVEEETKVIRQEIKSEVHGEERTAFGPFAIEGADGEDLLTLLFSAQLRYEGAGESPFDDNSLRFARVRPSIRGGFLNGKFSYAFQMNLAPGATELIDLFADYRFHDDVRLLVGQHKIHFTRYRSQSFTTTALVDWGDISRWHGAERQIGAVLHNHSAKGKQLQYSAGVYTGQNQRAAFANRLPGVYGEAIDNPSSFIDGAGLDGVHPEIVTALSYRSKNMFTGSLSSIRHRTLRGMASLSGSYDFRPELTQDATARLAPEFMLKWRGLGLQALYYLSWVTLSETEGHGAALGYHGPQVELSYRLNQRWEVAARYGGVFITEPLSSDARSRADEIISSAPDSEQGEQQQKYDHAGTERAEHELSVGANAYIVGNSLKLQCDASYLPRLSVDGWSADMRLRAQFQIAF